MSSSWKQKPDYLPTYYLGELKGDLHKALGIPADLVGLMVDAFFHIVEREILIGHRVYIPGLGYMMIRRPSRCTGQDFRRRIQVPLYPENLVLKFHHEPDVYFAVDESAPTTDKNDDIE